MSFDATTYNSIQGSYLLRMQMKPQPPSQNGNSGQTPFVDTNPPIMEDFIRNSEKKKQLQERRTRIDSEKSSSMHEMLQRLSRSRTEVSGLQRNLDAEQNPFKRKILEAQLGHKTAGTTQMEHSLSSSYDNGSGFLGSEGRIDTVGSFVTFG